MIEKNFFELSFIGRRKSNQDSSFVVARGDVIFLGVADGMGGTKGGEMASRIVAETCKKIILETSKNEISEKNLKVFLYNLINRCRDELQAAIKSKPELADMGTTLSCVLMAGNCYACANIGDSRVYLFNGKRLEKITTDHSIVEEYKKQYGDKVPDYIRAQGNVITRALGAGEDNPDIYPVDKDYYSLNEGHGFLICTDGLIIDKVIDNQTWMVDYLLGTKTLKDAAENMVCHAFYNDSNDNISVVLFEFGGFRRKRKRIKKYHFPPGSKPARKKKSILGYLKILGAIIASISAFFVGFLVFKDKSDGNQKRWVPFGELHTGSTINHKTENLIWINHPEQGSVEKYQLTFQYQPKGFWGWLARKTKLGVKEVSPTPKDNTILELGKLNLKPGLYKIRIVAIMKNGKMIKGGVVKLNLVGNQE